ncbi:MAG: hypothetical protein FWE53_04075 [Firmicutes bacterium]|nr:hypothetical protein [Bacillota bacterium]
MNLRDYANTEIKQESKPQDITEEKLKQAENDYGGLVNNFLDKYGNMNENELMGEMLKTIKQKKADGTYDPEQIRRAAMQIAPVLTPEQRSKMEKYLKFL